MLLSFKTKRNTNGHCRFIAIDTGAENYTFSNRYWSDITYAIEIKSKDFNEILLKCKNAGYTYSNNPIY